MPVILIGFMAAGKSSVARILDENFVDTDECLSEKFEMSISEYVSKYGTDAFRQQETALLADLLSSDRAQVIATGGGIIESKKNQSLLELQTDVVYLQADFSTLLQRLKKDSLCQRFIFENSDLSDLEQIYKERLPIYEQLSRVTIDTTHLTASEAAELIIEKTPF
ncbi:MAG: AAA family ATPase [Streptococcaceae bacterium]|jgi:shikimate kinase|nr:AAA family ATPase [Streptococcaceae bacterium]